MSKSNAEVAEAHQALQPVLQTIRELQRKAGTSYMVCLWLLAFLKNIIFICLSRTLAV